MEKEIKILKIDFPLFWTNAYKNKNRFYKYVFTETKQYVEKINLSKEYLKNDNCKKLWERHCEFCFEKITIELTRECYCTEDCFTWICQKCFNEHKDKYNWRVVEVQDIPKSGIINMDVKVVKK